jgi:glycosyltransferase involved in cell wall biosynthesis
MKAKKRLAFIGVGMIGTGSLGHGIPALANAIMVLREDYQITVYSFVPIDKSKVPSGILIRCISSDRLPQRVQYALLAVSFIFDHLKKRYAIIHAQSPFPAGMFSSFINKIFNIPWLLTLHAGEVARLPEVPFGDLMNPGLKRAALKCCKKATILSAVSIWQSKDVLKNLGIDRDVVVLTRGANVFPFKEKKISFPLKLLHVSNYHPIKDYDTLIKTFNVLSEKVSCQLTIVGTGYDQAFQLQNNNIKFTGGVSQSTMSELYEDAHILLHTSKFEGLPMVALEAMSHGVVVCGTHVGVMADLSGHYCITVPTGAYQQLAEEVLTLIQNPSKYDTIRQKAYEWIKNHDLSWHVKELKQVYEQLMELGSK